MTIRLVDFLETSILASAVPAMITQCVAAAGLLAAFVSLLLIRSQGVRRAREMGLLRSALTEAMEHGRKNFQEEIAEVRETLAEAEKNAQTNLDLLRDGRLGMPARARALRMLRSGMAAETTAMELGLARNEVQLLEKVSILLTPRN
jgi:hypothetical protein